MFTIGDFAAYGQVSVRMLRHYDAIGLLPPARVDPVTGHRGYEAAQLARLNRIIALKDLGFSLRQVAVLLDDRVDAEQLRGMLRLRRAELAAAAAAAADRLAQVERRLLTIESEGTMPVDEVVVKPLPALRVAALSGTADSFDPRHLGAVLRPLLRGARARIAAAGVQAAGPDLAWFEPLPEGAYGVTVHAGVPVRGGVPYVLLPAVPRAATLVHRGSPESVLASIQKLARWVEAAGLVPEPPGREHFLTAGGEPSSWLTEIQVPVAAPAAPGRTPPAAVPSPLRPGGGFPRS
jgi:DNA-binding transcriptional MerR regulator